MKFDNLLVITTYYPHQKNNLTGIFVKRQVDELKKHFNKVFVIAVNPKIPPPISSLKIVPKGTKDIYYAENYSHDNVEVYFVKALPLFYRNYFGKILFLKVKNLLEKLDVNIDIIHAHFTWPAGFVATQLKTIFNVPVVLTVHENREWLLDEIKSRSKIFGRIWNEVDKIIRVNQIDLAEFVKIGINESKLIAIPNGYPKDSFKPLNQRKCREALDLPLDQKILINIGTLEKKKGHKYLIEAMKIVCEKRNDILLYIIGHGHLMNELSKLIKKHNLQNNIILAGGNKPSEEIPIWYNASDIFVLPSLSEGNPTVMFESLGCGKPFIASNVGGIPEIIINDKLGLLVEPYDWKQLAESIKVGLDKKWDSNYIQEYGKQFTWEHIAKNIINIYEELLQN